jgi:hypothetical protein
MRIFLVEFEWKCCEKYVMASIGHAFQALGNLKQEQGHDFLKSTKTRGVVCGQLIQKSFKECGL